MKNRNAVRVAAVIVGAALALTGCTSQGPVDVASPTKQDLNLSMQAPPADLSIGNFNGGDTTIFFAVYDRLVAQNGAGVLEPSIAESWEYTEGNTVLTFKLRDGQTFSNGDVLDAAAVVTSIEAERIAPASAPQLASISSIEATDPATVVITLSQPDGALLYQLAGTNGAISAPSLVGDDAAKLAPVGSGAYVLSAQDTTAGSEYVLTKNADHWNADSYPFTTVNMKVVVDPTAVQNAMKTGQLDFATLASPDLVSQFPESDFTTGESSPTAVGALFIVDRAGLVVPALADVRVRQAINLAIDRDTIAEKLTPGVASATAQMASPIGDAYDAALNDVYAYNVDKAKALMAEAGYADGFSVTMPSTFLSQLFDATLAQQLSEIGITVVYETVPFQDLYAKLYAGVYGMFWLYNGYSASDAKDLTQILAGSFNPQATMTPELQTLRDAADAAALEDQGAAFGALNKYYVDQAWFAPVTAATGLWVAANSVTFTPPALYGGSLLAWQPAE